MKKILVLIAALCLLLPAAILADSSPNGDLRVGMECDYTPFNWTQAEPSEFSVPLEGGGYADGYDVRIARLIAEGLGRELVIVKTDWDGLPPALLSGKIDAIIAGMSPTAERAVTIDFTDPYYVSDLMIVVRRDSAYANAESLADFDGARITAQQNTFHYTVIGQIPGVVQETALANFPAMTVALASGKIDGYVSEQPHAEQVIKANPDLTFIAFAEGKGFEASMEDLSIAVGLKKGSDLLTPINEILSSISQDMRVELMIAATEDSELDA
jgi:ABC-type amino acid transport substrate-binding protein